MSEKNIKVGARVELTGKELFGTIAYVGMTSFAVGKWVGVVLDEPKGKNSGSIKGQQYFQCDENCGMFVRPTQLRVIIPVGGEQGGSGGSGNATPTLQPTKARLSGSRTSLSSSRQSLLGSRTQLTTSLSERTGSSSSLAPRKSLAPQSSKDKDASSTGSLVAEGGPAASATASKRASFVETGFLEILKPQFTPSQPMRSPSFTTCHS